LLDGVKVNEVITVCFVCSLVFSVVVEQLPTLLQTFTNGNESDEHEVNVDAFKMSVSCEVVKLKRNISIIKYYNCEAKNT